MPYTKDIQENKFTDQIESDLVIISPLNASVIQMEANCRQEMKEKTDKKGIQ